MSKYVSIDTGSTSGLKSQSGQLLPTVYSNITDSQNLIEPIEVIHDRAGDFRNKILHFVVTTRQIRLDTFLAGALGSTQASLII